MATLQATSTVGRAHAMSRTDTGASTTTRSELRVLMLGYSGANNTGAEALLLADIEDVRTVLPSLNASR